MTANTAMHSQLPQPELKFVPKSPRMIFFIVAAAVFIAEAFIMFLLSYLPDHSVWLSAVLDSTLLLLLVSPMLYFFLFQPMVNYIHEHQKIEETLRKNEEEQFKIMVRTSLDGFWITDRQGRFLEVNDAYCQLIGYSREELLNMRISDVEALENPEDTTRHINKLLANGSDCFETCHRHKNGHLVDVEVSANYSDLYEGRFYCFLRDITERKEKEAQIYNLAHYDALTGLPNRALFNDRLQQAISTARRDKTHIGLMFLDLDKFKPINDTFGHDVGDLVLKEVAKRLHQCVRDSDTISRIGGDEFIVLLPSIDAAQDALLVANKILLSLNQSFELAGHSMHLSSSIGIAIYPEHGSDAITLTKNADAAMYWAKDGGRNNAKLYQSGMAIN